MPRTITIRHQIGFHSEFPTNDASKRPHAIGTMHPGTIVPIVEEIEGFEFEKELSFSDVDGNIKKFTIKSKKWFKDKNDWWYWGGSTTTLEKAEEAHDDSPAPTPSLPTPPIVVPEQQFDWREKLKRGATPSSWWKHKGKGVNIAILDAGFDLGSHCFKHLKGNRIKTYDLRNADYEILSNLQNEDFVKDLSGKDKLPPDSHGTKCLSILASKDEQEEIMGIAPDANYFLFNVYERKVMGNRISLPKQSKELMDKAFWMISHLDIDIVSVSVSYPKDAIIASELINEIIRKETLWFWSLSTAARPSLEKYILNPSFPMPFFDVETVGVLKENQLSSPNNLVVDNLEKENIHYLLQENVVSLVRNKDTIQHNQKLTCSYATPALAGLAALKICEERKQDASFQLDNKNFLKDFRKASTRFYKDFIPGEDDYTFLRLDKGDNDVV